MKPEEVNIIIENIKESYPCDEFYKDYDYRINYYTQEEIDDVVIEALADHVLQLETRIDELESGDTE